MLEQILLRRTPTFVNGLPILRNHPGPTYEARIRRIGSSLLFDKTPKSDENYTYFLLKIEIHF